MKRFIHNIISGVLFFCIASVLLCSCEDEHMAPSSGSAISIVYSSVLFNPDGGTGTIEFASSQEVSAYSEQPWCEVSVEGNVVTVTAETYADLENRYASIILKASEDSVRVVAQQNGIIMSADVARTHTLSDAKAEISFKVESNAKVKVKSSASWLRCALSDKNVTVNIRDNDSGHPRSGWVEYSSGNVADTIWVSQCSPSDLYGNFRLLGYNSNNSLVYLPATISAGTEENDLKVSCNANGVMWSFDAEFNPESHTVSIVNAQNVGTVEASGYSFHVFLCLLSSLTSNFSWDPELVCTASVGYDDELESTIIKVNPLTYTGYNGNPMEVDSFVFAAFQNVDEATGLPKGNPSLYPAILFFPYFQSL